MPEVDTSEPPPTFADIEKNEYAQNWLIATAKRIGLERLFDWVYQTEQDYGSGRKDARAYLKKKRPDDDASFLDTPKKETEYFDERAKNMTVRAMNWLKREQARRAESMENGDGKSL